MICIINYGSGNIAALMNIFKQHRIPHFLASDPSRFNDADRFLLPGVGAFDPTMEQLTRSGIVEALGEQVLAKGKKVLGICVGMHLLAESSEEGERAGLGWISGRVRKIDVAGLAGPPHLPHMGWNSVRVRPGARLFDGVDQARGFYFLHSYYFDASRAEDVSSHVEYGAALPCGVENGNVFGVQFHPEKSHANGVRLLQNFALIA
jgi:glutamine amidotransferase